MATLAQRLLAANNGTDTGEFIPMGDPRVQTDEQGRQYVTKADGSKAYSRPLGYDASGQYTYDPSKLTTLDQPKALHNANTWNPSTGVYDPGSIDWGAMVPVLGGAGIGAAVAAPVLAGALGSSGAAGGAGGTGLSAGSSGVAAGLPGEMATLPSVAGGAGSAAGAGSATAAAAGIPQSEAEALASGYGSIAGPSASDVVGGIMPSTASRILSSLKDLSPVLSNAARSEADANRFSDQFNLNAAALNARLPGQRYSTALAAALPGMSTPYSITFGGPGSGLRNQAPTISGGIDWSKMPSDVSQLRDQVIHDLLMQELAGPVKQTPTSAGDKALGIGSTIAGIGGALSRFL